jgi:protein-disulfide isomerase
MKLGTGNGTWRRWGIALLVLAVGMMACRSEPTPRTRGRGGATATAGLGESDLATSGVPTACTDTFRKGGLPIGDAPRKGSSDALVAIVEFANLECADCAKAAGKVDELLQRFGDDLALYYVQSEGSPTPVQPGQPAPPRMWRLAAQASLAAAKSDKFWPFVERAYASGGKLDQPSLEQYAQQVGIDLNAFRSGMNARDVQDQVEAGQSLALDLGVRGPLPMFWVNGTLVQANEIDSRLAQLVEQEVGKARDALLAPRSRCEMLARQVVTRQMSGRGGAAGAQPPQRAQRPQEDPNALYKIPVGSSPVNGPADALVTLMLFTDFQCPHCARVAATLDELAKAYPNDLRLVYKNNPLPGHDKAQLAAEAAMVAGAQGKFWQFHDAMFAAMRTYYDSPNRDPAAPHPLDRPNLEKIAESLRLDMVAFRKGLDEHTMTAAIQADLELARRFAISGTPTFAMNGKKFSGNLPLDEFKRRVEAAMVEAKKLADSGVPRAQVYDKLVAAGSDRAVFLPMPAGAEMAAAQQPQRPTGPQPLPAEAKDVKVEAWNPTRGPANAKVTLVVFCEYLCPFCKKIQDTLKILQTAYGDQLRIAFRQHIVHPPAEPVSLAALAAQRQGKFEELHALFFANQGDLQQKCYQDANACRQAIDTYAGQVAGLDLNRLHTDMDSAEVRRQLDADKAAAGQYGAGGTPSLFVNGRLQVGAVPPSWFGSWIDQLLGKTGAPTVPASMDPVQQGGGGGCGAPRPAAAPPQPTPTAVGLAPVPLVNTVPPRQAPPPAAPAPVAARPARTAAAAQPAGTQPARPRPPRTTTTAPTPPPPPPAEDLPY